MTEDEQRAARRMDRIPSPPPAHGLTPEQEKAERKQLATRAERDRLKEAIDDLMAAHPQREPAYYQALAVLHQDHEAKLEAIDAAE